MSIIKTHEVTLYGGNNDYNVVLKPLSDEHLPLLYKWCADPQVLYWSEGGDADKDISYDADAVHQIYGGVSQDALCFLVEVEVEGVPIGECWLQKMNIPEVKAMYAHSLDVRRIDMSIGEKAYWNKGLGTTFIGMLVDFAFYGEGVDVLHCFCEDYNVRSCRIWEKHGFARILEEPVDNSWKGKLQYHYRLTRQEFVQRRRVKMPKDERFELPLADIQPSQLYISEGKMRLIREWFDPTDKTNFDPIPIKQLDGRLVMTDGHTRAVAAVLAQWDVVPVCWDTDQLDWSAYRTDVRWCLEQSIFIPHDLARRIVPHKDYQVLWCKRCNEMDSI